MERKTSETERGMRVLLWVMRPISAVVACVRWGAARGSGTGGTPIARARRACTGILFQACAGAYTGIRCTRIPRPERRQQLRGGARALHLVQNPRLRRDNIFPFGMRRHVAQKRAGRKTTIKAAFSRMGSSHSGCAIRTASGCRICNASNFRSENVSCTIQFPSQMCMFVRPVARFTYAPRLLSGANNISRSGGTLRTMATALLDVQMISLSALTSAEQLM